MRPLHGRLRGERLRGGDPRWRLTRAKWASTSRSRWKRSKPTTARRARSATSARSSRSAGRTARTCACAAPPPRPTRLSACSSSPNRSLSPTSAATTSESLSRGGARACRLRGDELEHLGGVLLHEARADAPDRQQRLLVCRAGGGDRLHGWVVRDG